MDNEHGKKITITGTTNRYLVKKLLKLDPVIKKRKDAAKEDIPPEYFTIDKQIEIIHDLCENNADIEYYKFIKGQIDKKISSYKQQDIDKRARALARGKTTLVSRPRFTGVTHLINAY